MKYILPLFCLILLGAGCTFKIPETTVTISDTIIYTGVQCEVNEDCTLPVEFATRSSCAYTTTCAAKQCAVVCPPPEDEEPTDVDIEPAVVVTNFEECAAAGNPIMESYPEQCNHNGEIFVKVYPAPVSNTPTANELPPSAITETNAGISLDGVTNVNGIILNWSVIDVDTSKGFKVVKGTNPNPMYGVDSSTYIENSDIRSYTVHLADGNVYYFRVCTYTGDGCDNYSNDVIVTAPTKIHDLGAKAELLELVPETADNTINVTNIELSKAFSNNTISWKTTGRAGWGYKIAYSKNLGPTYPSRDEEDNWIYVGDEFATSYRLPAEQGPGTYYVRVCTYIGSACGLYSNEVAVGLE